MADILNGRRSRPMLLVGALWAAIAPGLAAQDLPSALQACRAEPNDARRLACYDREVDAQRQPPVSGTAAQVAVPAAATPTAEERFGYQDVLAREERDKVQREGHDLEELHSMVARMTRRGDGALVITLENGQVWGQSTLDLYFPLRVGEQVRIRRAAMGSFLLYGNSKWSIRVTRLR